MTGFGLFILIILTIISLIVWYFIINRAVFNALSEHSKIHDPGSNFYKYIIKDAILTASAELNKNQIRVLIRDAVKEAMEELQKVKHNDEASS